MSPISRLRADARGSVFDKFALFCAAISVICVLGAHGLDSLSRNGGLPVISFDRSTAKAPNIDYAPTASIGARGQNNQLNPCGNR
jgi:hypothetical protein